MGRLVLILLLGSILIFGVISITVNRSTTDATSTTADYYKDITARNICNSMIQMAMSQLADSSSWRVATTASKSMFGGIAYYTVKDTAVAGDSLIKISVTSNFSGLTRTITTYVKFTQGWVPAVVRGAFTANSSLNQTISDMIIDGRDHDLSQNVIPNSGVYGVSSGTSFTNIQNAQIGGTKNGVDYPPQYPENPNSVEQNYSWGGTFPTTPDAILGYSEGTLKGIAQSKVNGSQYATTPGGVTYPVKGVTYIEPPGGTEYKVDFGKQQNSGIFVVYNSSRTSRIKQLKSTLPFQGLIIGDYMFHIHMDILGAMILLSPNLELSKVCNGNQDHWVYYSSAAIKNATFFASQYAGGGGGGATGSGYGKGRMAVQYWFE